MVSEHARHGHQGGRLAMSRTKTSFHRASSSREFGADRFGHQTGQRRSAQHAGPRPYTEDFVLAQNFVPGIPGKSAENFNTNYLVVFKRILYWSQT